MNLIAAIDSLRLGDEVRSELEFVELVEGGLPMEPI